MRGLFLLSVSLLSACLEPAPPTHPAADSAVVDLVSGRTQVEHTQAQLEQDSTTLTTERESLDAHRQTIAARLAAINSSERSYANEHARLQSELDAADRAADELRTREGSLRTERDVLQRQARSLTARLEEMLRNGDALWQRELRLSMREAELAEREAALARREMALLRRHQEFLTTIDLQQLRDQLTQVTMIKTEPIPTAPALAPTQTRWTGDPKAKTIW